MAVSDLQIVKEALLDEQHFVDLHRQEWVPSLRRVVKRIERLERQRDTAVEAARLDLATALDPDMWGS